MGDFYCENVFSGKVTITKITETDNILAYYHTNPSWSTHVVIVPKHHFNNIFDTNSDVISEIFVVAKKVIELLNLTDYKIITNGGSFQDSKHLHFHLVSGHSIK